MDAHQTTAPHSYVSESKRYSFSGRIMLCAIIILFAVILIMLSLHLYVRCYILRSRRRQIRRARRRTHLVFYIEPENPSNILSIPTHGLDAAVLKSLPTFTFTKEDELLECAVCLSEFEVGEKGRLLPKCKHCFHLECIDMWFHSHSTCPLCRSPVDHGDIQSGDEVVVDLTQSQLEMVSESTQVLGTSQSESEGAVGPSSSFDGRIKGVDLMGVSIEVPRRSHSFCFGGSKSDESGPSRSPGFKSPTSRILSLKRILSREKKSPVLSPSPTGARSSCCESDFELGRVESSSQALSQK